MATNEIKTAAPALDRGLDILELVARRSTLGYGAIVDTLGLPTASAARLLKRLCHRGYLTKDSETGNYRMGASVKALLPRQIARRRLLEIAAPVLRYLRDESRQTAIMFHWNGHAWECIAKELHETSVTMQQVGEIRVDVFEYPWGCFAYSQLKKEKRKLVLNVSPMVASRLEGHAAMYCEKGYVAELSDYLNRFTVPINDENGDLIGALAMGVTTPILKEFGHDRIVELIVMSGKRI